MIFIKKVLFYCCILMFTFSCEKAEIKTFEPEQKIHENLTESNINFISDVTLEEIPDIAQNIEKQILKSPLSWSSNKGKKDKFWLDKDNIIKVEDSIGNLTYSFQIMEKNPNPKVMLNLIATKRSNGEFISPFIMKYKFDKGNRYEYALQEDKKFMGKVDVISLKEFANKLKLTLRTADVDPCYRNIDPSYADGGSSGGGASSGGIGPDYSNSTGGGRLSLATYREVYRNRGSVEVGEGSFGTFGTDGEMHKSTTLRTDPDCVEGNILIPINQLFERLCGTYQFTEVGESYQANIRNLGFTAAVISSNGEYDLRSINISNMCVGVPSHWTTAGHLGNNFSTAYNTAIVELFGLINALPAGKSPTDAWLESTLTDLVGLNLNALYLDEFMNGTGLAVATRANCRGVSSTNAQWCRY